MEQNILFAVEKLLILIARHFVYPTGKPIIPHLLRYQGLAVGGYGFAHDALELGGHLRLSLN